MPTLNAPQLIKYLSVRSKLLHKIKMNPGALLVFLKLHFLPQIASVKSAQMVLGVELSPGQRLSWSHPSCQLSPTQLGLTQSPHVRIEERIGRVK